MPTRTITGTIVRPSGAAWSAATLTFKLRARFVVDSDTVLPDRVTATTDEDGAFSVALAVPDTGTASYEFTAPAGGSAVFYLEAGAPIELAVLLAARGVSVSPDAVAVEAGLRAAARAGSARPASWAAGVVGGDALSWGEADDGLIDRWDALPEWPQMLLRALMFRLAVHALHPRATASAFPGLARTAALVRLAL